MASNNTAQTPQPNLEEVINISSSEPSAKKQPPPIAPATDGMKIKQDPGVKLTTEDDSDIEILTPSRFPKRPGTSDSNSNNIEGIGNGEDDDIQVTESNTVNPNVDHPHARQYCGVHPFAPNVGNGTTTNINFCSKCYCFVCDKLASECDSWDTTSGGHCNAHDKDEKYVQLREVTLNARGVTTSRPSALDGEVTLLNSQPPRNPYQQQQRGSGGGGMMQQMTSLIHNEFLTRLGTGNDTSDAATARASVEESRRQNTKQKKDMRITEILVENFKKSVSLSAASVSAKENKVPTQQKMDGDITPLSLHNSFYVEGVKIGWPFPEIMKPQRQMAIHLIKALKNKRHVVLESPTGTGKSAAILCSTLAWQRYHCKMEQAKRQQKSSDDEPDINSKVGKVKIIYCSRTHSQVAQMVASLKSTPYRPRMAILGSRERLCIHKDIKPRGNNTNEVKNVNVNNECRLRVRNTEKSRKHMLTNMSTNEPYNDEDPPEVMPGDGTEDPIMADGPTEENSNDNFLRRRRTCPHYRQLTTSRVANLAHSTFVPNSKVNCCSVGGKKSKYGAHDIEDLVDFGVDPYLQKEVALYRREPNESFGLSLKSSTGRDRGSFVKTVKKDTPADINGNIKADDKIIRVNGTDVSSSNPATVVNKIKSTTDPLLLDVSRSGSLDGGSGGYSSRAACPYYLSQVLSKDADIIFCPYNYVLDPSIREALGIELENSVVVLDEGHNVESTLREAGSGKFGEFELCELIVMLNNYAITEKSTTNMMDISTSMLSPEESETAFLCDVAHTLLMFVEKIVTKLKTTRISFQSNPGAKGAEKVLQDWEKFHTSDDTEFEVTFDGPTGRGTNGKCVGCMPFFDRLGLTKQDFDGLCTYVDAFDKHIRGGNENEESNERDRVSNLLDRLSELCHKLKMGINMPEHYYAAILATANGSLAFANGEVVDETEGNGRYQKKKPRELPLIPPRTKEHPERPANPCRDPYCRAKCTDAFNPIRHGDACNGSTPKWECILHLDLLTPGPLMQELSNACRTVVLASGSLSPIPSLCAELNLFPPDDKMSPVKTSHNTNDKVLPKIQRRLQNQPRPLEADHVVDLEKQLCAVSIGHLPDGSELRVTQKNTSRPDFIPKLGDAIVTIVAGIPSGGVLVFLPSYALLRKCEKQWNPNSFRQNNRRSFWSQHEDNMDDEESVWDRLKDLKHNVIVEPTGGQDSFEEAKQEYMDSVKNKGGCVLFAVFRGKMSEGISFNDENARGVICVGLPLPSAFALPIKVKKDYNDEQRKLRNRTDLLPGYDWYQQQAYRAIAQALGRCIRHAGDYGAIFLLDARHCDDGSPNNGIPQAHKNLPQWMRRAVKNLSQGTGRSSIFNQSTSNTIPGGWPALQAELKRFFRHAKPHCREVLRKQKEKLSVAQGKKTAVLPSSTTPSQLNKANGSTRTSSPIDLSSSPEATTSSSNGRIQVVERQPSTLAKTKATKPNQNQSTIKKKEGTLKAMFQKQEAQGSSLKKRAADESSSTKSKAAKRANNKGPLQSMFAKQVAASSIDAQQPPSKDTVGDEKDVEDDEDMEEDDNEEDEESTTSKQPSAPPPAANSFTFKKSPFADETSTPATEVTASASQLVINQSQTVSAMDQEEHFCVVCEDGKKEIMLLPCKHMCLCKSCASKCLMKQMTECPMCRTKIEDSIEVFW